MNIPKAILLALTVASLLLTGAGTPTATAQPTVPEGPARLWQARGGLNNFFAKVKSGQEVSVAYLGGSITAAAGWRVQTLNWMRERFPQTKFREINAAIPGTGSTLGVYRLGQDVLQHKPDLLFIEFAVNDGGAPAENMARAVEGIVRQNKTANPQTDICFVYTFRTGHEKFLERSVSPPAASVHESVAEHYGLPSINLGVRVVEEAKAGKLVYQSAADAVAPGVMAFSSDGIHPGAEGHTLYTKVITDALTELKEAATEPVASPLPAPLRSDNWEGAHLESPTRATLSAGWKKLPENDPIQTKFKNQLAEIWEATKPGETLSFTFKGTHAALYDFCAPDAAQVIVTVDGKSGTPINRLEAVTSYPRLSILPIAAGLPDGVHTVSVEIMADEPDRSAIVAREKLKPNFRPELYHGTVLRVGAIMLIGEIVP